MFVDQPALADVLFDARRSDIGQRGADIMQSNARWLIENPGFIVLIEGHSDFKGSPQGNLALGERRARAARDFLVRAGVSPDRIQIATYGSERPLCPEKTEACAARNRRVHFLVRPQ
ncbi:MAG TPA: OmpA family protein [Candidatus Methylomirabilis sp.]|nr:OmpA family protein [Candidatus Methylomirabilis sp.]